MSKTNLIKNYLDKRFEELRSIDDTPRMFVKTSDGKDSVRFGVVDDWKLLQGKVMVIMNRKDIFAIQNMFGLTYKNSEEILMNYILDKFGYDKSLGANSVTIDL